MKDDTLIPYIMMAILALVFLLVHTINISEELRTYKDIVSQDKIELIKTIETLEQDINAQRKINARCMNRRVELTRRINNHRCVP